MTKLMAKIPQISEFSKTVLLLGLFICIVLFVFAFVSTLFSESEYITPYIVNIFASAALKSLVMTVLCTLVTDWLIKSAVKDTDNK